MLPGQKLVNGHISVEPLPPLWLLYCKSAERVHRPGSRRLGGVEATGASPGVDPSRPHRSGPRAGPGRRTPCARGAWGGEPAGGWASDEVRALNQALRLVRSCSAQKTSARIAGLFLPRGPEKG